MIHLKYFKDFVNEIFKDELISIADEPRKARSSRINVRYSGITQRTAKSRTKTLKFEAQDPEGSGNWWLVQIKIPDYKAVSHLKKDTIEEKVKLAIEAGDINIDCQCQDFGFKGFRYMANQLDYAVEPEDRKPVIRNPELQGSMCKHCIATLETISDFYDDITDDIEKYQEAERSKERERKQK